MNASIVCGNLYSTYFTFYFQCLLSANSAKCFALFIYYFFFSQFTLTCKHTFASTSTYMCDIYISAYIFNNVYKSSVYYNFELYPYLFGFWHTVFALCHQWSSTLHTYPYHHIPILSHPATNAPNAPNASNAPKAPQMSHVFKWVLFFVTAMQIANPAQQMANP